ncbi:DNA adenine methylase [Algoriphagus iocasae]|uniref:Site-specific DNA-methyltransferase (adenine-specific) n=1 Tax=Algoriphagus iocasae TaxID=1836499 RepID=A0A841MWG9_9BACT|nr:Dam family site-specific DNA-(adenine-N6)-methyltransferase [Algoriphagus iocasae]MBB6328396.1 DNA adenine methylase [Algoriphagus iocasae]
MISETINIEKKALPFLRWTGSKTWLVRDGFSNFLPKQFNNYHECFLGGGSIFFSLTPFHRNAYLYDTNEELIETYIEVRDNVDLVIRSLRKLKNTKEDYYKIRKTRYLTPHTRAAKFIYLNRCSFNGIYRVNNKGEYNVPYGKRPNVDVVTKENLMNASKVLKNVIIKSIDFEKTLSYIQKDDLVFLDPPYTVAHENNGFIEYNQKLFSWEDQERLRDHIKEIEKRGAYYILTNAYHKSIIELYSGIGSMHKRARYSQVGGRNKTRGMYNELIICNTI